MGAIDGLFIKKTPPPVATTMDTLAHYSGGKSGYGINAQTLVTANYRVYCRVSPVSTVAPGVTNDWVAYGQSSLCEAVNSLPAGFHVLGDADYSLSKTLITPYPGKNLPDNTDSFNFHLSQRRIKVEQTFGTFVNTLGVLWRPLRVFFFGAGRPHQSAVLPA